MSSETEKRELKLVWGERMQKELKEWEEKHKKLQEQKEAVREGLIQECGVKLKVKEDKLEGIEKEKEALMHDKYNLESQVDKLKNNLTLKEDSIESLTENITKLRNQLNSAEEANKLVEKNLHQRELQVAALEQSQQRQEKALNQLEALKNEAQNCTTKTQSSVDKQALQITDLKNRVMECEARERKSDEILRKFQRDGIEMKTKLNKFVQIVKKLEEVILKKEKDLVSLKDKLLVKIKFYTIYISLMMFLFCIYIRELMRILSIQECMIEFTLVIYFVIIAPHLTILCRNLGILVIDKEPEVLYRNGLHFLRM